MSRRKSLGREGGVFCFSAAFDGKDMPPFTWIEPRVASRDRAFSARTRPARLNDRRNASASEPYNLFRTRCLFVGRRVSMSDNPESNPTPQEAFHRSSEPDLANLQHARFFGRTDWLSFGVTALTVLAVYLFTLAPDVTPGSSGVFSVGAMYAGVPLPPGLPLWTIYAHLFTLLPFSNVAWRVALSSAVAGALTCGVIALMASRGETALIE